MDSAATFLTCSHGDRCHGVLLDETATTLRVSAQLLDGTQLSDGAVMLGQAGGGQPADLHELHPTEPRLADALHWQRRRHTAAAQPPSNEASHLDAPRHPKVRIKQEYSIWKKIWHLNFTLCNHPCNNYKY